MTSSPDILVMGGGAIGLAIALELQLRGAAVTVLSRDVSQAASQAAAGMLAPQAEQIPPGPLLNLCLRSRSVYPDWIRKLEELTGLEAGYWACGILAPVYASLNQALQTETQFGPLSDPQWLDRSSLDHHQPGLSSEVVGGWWYPQDAQVDNRALTKALWVAAQEVGVEVRSGATVEAIVRQGDRVEQVQSTVGNWQASHYVLATGAWSQDLLSIPVTPRKGQLLSVRVPLAGGKALPLQTVLFGEEIYIVPRRDGRIVIGATSENVGFAPENTPTGIQTLLTAAMRLFPAIAQFPIQEFWWGFRPATPDESPILGASPYKNLTLATGHYRNGILLTPITAQLVANWIWHQDADPLLQAFHWSRFNH